MNTKSKITCLFAIIAGWAIAPAFAEESIDWNDTYDKTNRLLFNARLDHRVGSGQRAYADELIEVSLTTTKSVMMLSNREHIGSDLAYGVRDMVDFVSEFYGVSSFYSKGNTERMRELYDLVNDLKKQVEPLVYLNVDDIIQDEVDALKESSETGQYCQQRHDIYRNEDEELCSPLYADDLYKKIDELKAKKRTELIEERFSGQMQEIAELIDQILEDKQS